MIETMKVIFSRLSSNWRVYFEEAAGNEIPRDYIVYKLPPGSSEKHRDNLVLEVTLWSYLDGRDTTHLETEWMALDRELRHHVHLDQHQFLKFEKISQGMIPDPDSNVRRRELRYLIKREERIDH